MSEPTSIIIIEFDPATADTPENAEIERKVQRLVRLALKRCKTKDDLARAVVALVEATARVVIAPHQVDAREAARAAGELLTTVALARAAGLPPSEADIPRGRATLQ